MRLPCASPLRHHACHDRLPSLISFSHIHSQHSTTSYYPFFIFHHALHNPIPLTTYPSITSHHPSPITHHTHRTSPIIHPPFTSPHSPLHPPSPIQHALRFLFMPCYLPLSLYPSPSISNLIYASCLCSFVKLSLVLPFSFARKSFMLLFPSSFFTLVSIHSSSRSFSLYYSLWSYSLHYSPPSSSRSS